MRKLSTNKQDKEISIQGKILCEMIARCSSLNLVGRRAKDGEFRKKLNEPPWKCPQGYQVTNIELENFHMELLEAKQNTHHLVILQLHGGGYIEKLTNVHRSKGILYSEAGKGASVLTIDYRVAPENPYPAALEDAIEAYLWLLENDFCSDEIILAGDSAGGGLAMALCMYLRDHKLPLPKGIVAMSPWTDMTASGTSYDDNYEKDPLFGKTRDSLIYNKDYLGEEDPTNPYLSPLFGDFTDFPPMLIQVGTIEMLLSDSVSVAKKAREYGVKVRLSKYEGMFHVFQHAMLLMPESRKAWVEVEKFIEVLVEAKS